MTAFFSKVIGESNVMVRMAQGGAGGEEFPGAEDLAEMQRFLEQNGKPCCVNLITDADNKFLANLKQGQDAMRSTISGASHKSLPDVVEDAHGTGTDGEEKGRLDGTS